MFLVLLNKETAEGVPVTTFSVAVNRKWTGSDGKPGEEVTWFRVTAWRKLAEVCNQYLAKGRQVTPYQYGMVVGRVGASAWTGQDGNPRASLEVTAIDVRFLGGGRDETAGGNGHGTASYEDVVGEEIPFQGGEERAQSGCGCPGLCGLAVHRAGMACDFPWRLGGCAPRTYLGRLAMQLLTNNTSQAFLQFLALHGLPQGLVDQGLVAALARLRLALRGT